ALLLEGLQDGGVAQWAMQGARPSPVGRSALRNCGILTYFLDTAQGARNAAGLSKRANGRGAPRARGWGARPEKSHGRPADPVARAAGLACWSGPVAPEPLA